jgi:hypothetical protein
MPWYKSGTVACTLNSTTVTGTGTAFAANARVGDAYLGPDGRWYEVANIASDTVLSILPAYLGATVAAGVYALAPMQGYVKDSADALRALVNQYGEKLAALGTTGNYEILPVVKGGTGRSDGRAAFSEVGVQAAAALFNQQGMYMGWNAASAGEGHFVVNKGNGNGGFTWRSVNAGNTAAGPTMSYSYDGVLAVPLELQVPKISGLTTALSTAQGGTGNTTGTATKLAASAIVGTVGQAGGISTGAIIERGSNANGEYTRYADGTQICTRSLSAQRTLNKASGPLFYDAKEVQPAYPIAFFSTPKVSIQVTGFTYEVMWLGASWTSALTAWPSGYVMTEVTRPSSDLVYFDYIAIGRWF